MFTEQILDRSAIDDVNIICNLREINIFHEHKHFYGIKLRIDGTMVTNKDSASIHLS